MDDRRVGAAIRAVRLRLNLRQQDVAARAEVSQQHVSLIERGHLDQVTVRTLRRVGAAVEIGLPIEPRWRGGELTRLLDLEHAALVEATARRLSHAGWSVDIEYTFNHFGERGSVDVLGWQDRRQVMLVIEVKSRVVDVQDMIAGLDRKARIVPGLVARERGLPVASIGRLLVVGEGSANRAVIARHPEMFAAAFPSRGAEVRGWLREPRGRLAGILFLSGTPVVSGKRGLRAGRAPARRSPRSVPGPPSDQRARAGP